MLNTDELCELLEEIKAKLFVAQTSSYDQFAYYTQVLEELYETYCEHFKDK